VIVPLSAVFGLESVEMHSNSFNNPRKEVLYAVSRLEVVATWLVAVVNVRRPKYLELASNKFVKWPASRITTSSETTLVQT
jgi:hypothetical protein